MEWQKKLIWVALALVLISWGVVLFDVWSVLTAHLDKNNWMTLALIYPGASLALIGAYRGTLQGTRVGGQVLLAIVLVILSWSVAFALMGKIGR